MFDFDADSKRLTLAGELTIYQAADVRNALLQAKASDCSEIDLSNVTELDTAGLQLLFAATIDGMKLTGISDSVRDVMALINSPLASPQVPEAM